MCQRADGIEGQVAPQLDPKFAPDIFADRCFEASVHHDLGQALDAFAARAIGLTKGKAVTLHDPDHARRDQFCGRVDHASDHALGFDVGRNQTTWVYRLNGAPLPGASQLMEVPPGDAVDHAHHHGLGAEQAAQVR